MFCVLGIIMNRLIVDNHVMFYVYPGCVFLSVETRPLMILNHRTHVNWSPSSL